jgi:hypothetical protein
MTSLPKLHLQSAGFCAVLVALNWFRTVDYSRGLGLQHESINGVGGALLIAAVAVLMLSRRIFRAVRWRLEHGRTVTPGRWIRSWGAIFYALPLLLRFNQGSSWIEPDGARATSLGGYGHDLSSFVFLLAVAALLLFQIAERLDDRSPHQDELSVAA